jgi:hypothetical protein
MAHIRASRAARSALASILTVATAAVVLAGCGGSSSGAKSSSAPAAGGASAQVQSSAGSAQSSAAGSAATGGSASAGSSHSGGSRSGGSGTSGGQGKGKQHLRAIDIVSKPSAHKARGGPDEPVVPAIKAPNPCRLVSQTEAQSILGQSVSMTEAPLGPTCIMRVGQQKQVVTLAVETVSLQSQVKQMHQLEKATVGGHQTFCGKLGQSQFYLSLTGGKAIAVSAPCAMARALAATALTHLKA